MKIFPRLATHVAHVCLGDPSLMEPLRNPKSLIGRGHCRNKESDGPDFLVMLSSISSLRVGQHHEVVNYSGCSRFGGLGLC